MNGKLHQTIIPEITSFSGRWIDDKGKAHNIIRETCNICGEILSEFHYCCCEYQCTGFRKHEKHQCKELAGGER